MSFAFSALTLLVWQQEGHLACKNWVVRYWHGYLSEALCKRFAYSHSWCYCHPIIFCSSKIQNDLPYWCRFIQVVLEKRPLNGCSGGGGGGGSGHMLLLTAASAFGLGRRLWSSSRRCYLHHVHAMLQASTLPPKYASSHSFSLATDPLVALQWYGDSRAPLSVA